MTSCKQATTLTFEIPYNFHKMLSAFCCLRYSFTKTKELSSMFIERNARTRHRLTFVCTLAYVLRCSITQQCRNDDTYCSFARFGGAHSGDAEEWGSNITSDILQCREVSKLYGEEYQRRKGIVGKVGPDVSKDRNAFRWSYYYLSKRRDLFARWQSVTFQDTQITNTFTTARIFMCFMSQLLYQRSEHIHYGNSVRST